MMTTNNAAVSSPFNPKSFQEAWEKISGQIDRIEKNVSENGNPIICIYCCDGDMTISKHRADIWFTPKEGGRPKRFILNKRFDLEKVPTGKFDFNAWFATKY